MYEMLKQWPGDRLSENVVVGALGCLSHALRLRIYRLLVRAGSNGLVARRSPALRAKETSGGTTLSFHLKSLSHAELVSVEQQGRYQRYRANIPLMLRVIAYLTENCCREDPSQCEAFRSAVPDVRPFLPPLA